MKPIKTAVFGAGFVGRVHLDALRRLEGVEIAALAATNSALGRQLSASFSIPAVTADYREILRDPAIDAVHICTPNGLHFAMAKAALEAGKHVVCEKPLTATAAEAVELVELAARRKLRNCVCHNLRSYPMAQQMRGMVQAGELGEIISVQGGYAQDWLLYDTDWNWRIDAAAGGPSRCMADIGSHWFDLAEHVTGLRVTALCADLETFHPTRKQPKGSIETFANKMLSADDYIERAVETEDFGAVIFRMGGRARGAMTASQLAAGRKNRLSLEVYGSKASVAWNQERPNELWIGHRDAPNQTIVKDPALLGSEARGYADLPGGHAEGYGDTFKQIFRRFYASMRDSGLAPEYPRFTDGLRQLKLLEAEFESHRTRSWVEVPAL